MSLPRHARNLVRKSSIIVPSKPLRDFSVHVPSSVGPLEMSWNTYHAAQVVTGMNLLRIYSSGDVNVPPVTNFQELLQHPNYAEEGTRLQSFKHWCGVIPAAELADAGLYMVAHDTVKCYSCRVVIQGWKQGDKPIDMHCLYNSNCDFVKNYILKLSEIDDLHNMASRNIAGILNHGERPVIKERIKDNSYSSTKPISIIRDSKSPQVPCHQAPKVVHPAGEQSSSTYGCLAKGSTTKTSDYAMYTLPSEKMIMSEQRLYVEGYHVADDTQATVLPMMCKICHNNKVDCVCLPCGDAKTCTSCATRLFNSGQPCYFCNQTVAAVHPIYL